MNRIKQLYVIALLLCTPLLSFDLISQHVYLEAFDEVLIGPENVNIHLAEQKNYYQAKYNGLLDYIITVQDELGQELQTIMNDKKNKRKRVKRQEEIKEELEYLNEEETLVYKYMDFWDEFEMSEDSIQIDISKCYEIRDRSGTYTEDDFLVINPVSDDSISWRECLPLHRVVRERLMIKPATTKWVNYDGDTMRKVDIPAEYKTVSKEVENSNYSNFHRTKQDDFARRISVLRDETLPTERLKILDINTFYEIAVTAAVLTDCE